MAYSIKGLPWQYKGSKDVTQCRTSAQVIEKTENIYNTAMDIFNLSDVQNITTHQAALNIAQKRIDDRKKELQNK